MKHLTPISPEKNKKEKELSTMLESMENKHGMYLLLQYAISLTFMSIITYYLFIMGKLLMF